MDRTVASIEPSTHEDEVGMVRVYLDDRALNKYALLFPDAAQRLDWQMVLARTNVMDFPSTAPVYQDIDGVTTQVEGPLDDEGLNFTRRSS